MVTRGALKLKKKKKIKLVAGLYKRKVKAEVEIEKLRKMQKHPKFQRLFEIEKAEIEF